MESVRGLNLICWYISGLEPEMPVTEKILEIEKRSTTLQYLEN